MIEAIKKGAKALWRGIVKVFAGPVRGDPR